MFTPETIALIRRALAGEAPIAPKRGARFHFEWPGAVQAHPHRHERHDNRRDRQADDGDHDVPYPRREAIVPVAPSPG